MPDGDEISEWDAGSEAERERRRSGEAMEAALEGLIIPDVIPPRPRTNDDPDYQRNKRKRRTTTSSEMAQTP